MRCVRRVSAAAVAAAAFLVCCVCVSAGPARAGDDGAQFLLFSGADLWRDGQFMHGGLLWSPERARPRRLHAASDDLGRAVPLRIRCAQQCLGDRHRGGRATAARLALQARSARAQGVRRARHQERRHQPLRSWQPAARHIGRAAPPSIYGSSRRPRPCLPPMRHCCRSPPAMRRALPMAGGYTIGSISARRRRPSPATASASCGSAHI